MPEKKYRLCDITSFIILIVLSLITLSVLVSSTFYHYSRFSIYCVRSTAFILCLLLIYLSVRSKRLFDSWAFFLILIMVNPFMEKYVMLPLYWNILGSIIFLFFAYFTYTYYLNIRGKEKD